MSQMLFLYLLFVKIAVFTFGGGYAMIPLFQSELVDTYALLTPQAFADLVALAQMTPGPVGLNAATYIGCQQGMAWAGIPGGILGAALSTLGLLTPSIVLMTAAAIFLAKFKDNKYLKPVLDGIRPATLGLIGAAVIFFANMSVFSAPVQTLWQGAAGKFGLNWQGCVIFALALTVRAKFKTGIFAILAGSMLLGIVLHLF